MFETIQSICLWFVLSVLNPIIGFFINSHLRYFWVYLVSGLVLAFIWYQFHKKEKSFAEVLFDKKVWLSKSAFVDYKILFINSVISIFVITNILLAFDQLSAPTAEFFKQMGVQSAAISSENILAALLLTIALFVVVDGLRFFLHYLLHKVPFLWELHKVHHSAEQLNFTTSERFHPAELLFSGAIMGIGLALTNGVFWAFLGDQLTPMTILGANFLWFFANIFGGILRHSPFFLSYGERLEKWFISPAMHHIHHSDNVVHYDKNFGSTLTIWDRMAGSHVPAFDQKVDKFGIGEETKEFRSLSYAYFSPLQKAWDQLRSFQDMSLANKGVVGVTFIAFAGVFLTTLTSSDVQSEVRKNTNNQTPGQMRLEKLVQNELPSSVWMEDLTHAEISVLQKSGFESVIVPTGGTEQNGFHMVLGKHNFVVRYTAEQIAKKAGTTIIAPVLPYVPEGRITPPQGHMKFAGTLSLPASVFEAVLENTANSLKQHGFKNIYFLGDSGGNQKSQNRVAQKLTAKWRKQGVQVRNLSDYYFKNNQVEFLMSKGFSKGDIGSHAGIRDTSELLAVKPEGVRNSVLQSKEQLPQGFDLAGYTGMPQKAHADLGQKMLSQKIEAATAQIKQLRK